MLETAIVTAIVIAAICWTIRHFTRSLTGNAGSPRCNGCPCNGVCSALESKEEIHK